MDVSVLGPRRIGAERDVRRGRLDRVDNSMCREMYNADRSAVYLILEHRLIGLTAKTDGLLVVFEGSANVLYLGPCVRQRLESAGILEQGVIRIAHRKEFGVIFLAFVRFPQGQINRSRRRIRYRIGPGQEG